MSYVTTENTDQLQARYTTEICTALANARLNQQFEPLMLWDGNFNLPTKMILIIQLNKSYLPAVSTTLVYGNDPHILGKAIRLLVHLEATFNLFKLIEPYNVRSILVTTATDPRQMNNRNKWVLETEFAKTIIKQLLFLKGHNTQVYEAALAAHIKENFI
jgi:hypothetical protein